MNPECESDERRTPIGETQYPLDDFRAALADRFRAQAFVTTSDLANDVGCTRETARVKLNDLVEEGILESRLVGASARVWFPTTMDQNVQSDLWSATEQASESGDSSPGQMASAPGQTDDERIMFFPSRREIVVDEPTEETRRILSQTSHLVDATGDGYLYKVSEADVWNTPYDEFDEFIADLKTVVGEDRWDAGFESRIKDDWDRAHQFRMYTLEGGYTVLDAADDDAFENVAKRKLEYNDHYTQYVGDTGMRLKSGSAADVKELLYDEGYPVIDERRLDEGADLDVRLRDDIELRDYQQEWVDHFEARKSGVFVGPSGAGKTVAALGAMEAIGGETLILVPNRELASQWREEIQDKLELPGGVMQNVKNIGEYHGGEKNIRPVTIATYDTAAMSRHRKLFNEREWGLVIADECLTGDTEVVTLDGRTTFNELDERLKLDHGWNRNVDLQVQTFDPETGEYHATEVKGLYKKEAAVEEITTRDGRKITSTQTHPHLIFDSETGKIVQKAEVEEGDYLVTPLGRPDIVGEGSATAELIGWFIGDGTLSECGAVKFSFGHRPEEQIGVISSLCDELGLDYSTYWNERGDYTIRIPDAENALPINVEAGAKANTIRVPREGYWLSDEDVAALLRGLFDAEGWVDEATNRPQFGTTSKGLVNDVRFLLDKLGFESRLTTRERDDPHNTLYRLTLPAYDGPGFIDTVNPRLDYKWQHVNRGDLPRNGIAATPILLRLKNELDLSGDALGELMGGDRSVVSPAIRRDAEVPRERLLKLATELSELSEPEPDSDPLTLREKWGLSYRIIAEQAGEDMSYSRKLLVGEETSPDKLERIKTAIEDLAAERRRVASTYAERLGQLANVSTSKVVDVEPNGTETVYDFETEKHTFLANGFLTDNCHHAVADTWKRFREIQSVARLGLSATPVRESGDAKEIYTLIGPPVGTDWGSLFADGWVEKPDVELFMVPWGSDDEREDYREATGNSKLIEAASNTAKADVVASLLDRHGDAKTIVFVDWIRQGNALAEALDLPFIYGETSHDRRDELYQQFRDGELDALIISRVGDEGIDLPDAEVAILASTMGSSRSQTGQRAGRTMRPFGDSQVYILLTKGSGEEEWGRESTQYLAEKGIDITKREAGDLV